jgi:4-hydroxybenzoate polyprenyltransferase
MDLLVSLHLAQLGMALSSVAFVLVGAGLLGRQLPPAVYAAAFFGTWAIYLWDARDSFSAEDRINQPLRAALFHEFRRWVRWLAPGSLLIAGLLLWPFRGVSGAEWAVPALGICGLAYVFPLIPRPGGWARVKDIPFLKLGVISAAWALGGAGVPLLLGSRFAPERAPLGRLLLVHVALLSLDTFALNYRDRRGDAAARLTTLAHVAGPRALRWLRAGAWATAVLAAFLFTGGARVVETAMAFGFAIATLALPALERSEVGYSMAVGGWRFVGALVYLGWYGQ